MSRSNRIGADGVVAQASSWSTTPPRTLWSLRDICLMSSAPLLARRGDGSPPPRRIRNRLTLSLR